MFILSSKNIFNQKDSIFIILRALGSNIFWLWIQNILNKYIEWLGDFSKRVASIMFAE